GVGGRAGGVYREEGPRPSALVLELVGDDALEADHEGQAAAPGPEEAVQVHAVDEVGVQRRAPGHTGVVEPSVQRVEAGAHAERPEVQAVTERLEAALEAGGAGEGAAPLQRGLRRGGEGGAAPAPLTP